MTSLFSLASDLKTRINETEAKVGVVGLGYVGLPLALQGVRSGYYCTGLDLSERVVALLNGATSHVDDVADGSAEVAVGRASTG